MSYSGVTGFLRQGLVGLSFFVVEHQPSSSGILLGFLTYKPQLGVLFPLALLASRNWATATSPGLAGAAAAAFGYRGWPSLISSLFDRNASFTGWGRT
jgi:hypothetical protein